MFTTEGHVIRLARELRRDVNQEYGIVQKKENWMCEQDLPLARRNQSTHAVSVFCEFKCILVVWSHECVFLHDCIEMQCVCVCAKLTSLSISTKLCTLCKGFTFISLVSLNPLLFHSTCGYTLSTHTLSTSVVCSHGE